MIDWNLVDTQNNELNDKELHLPTYYSKLSPSDKIKVRDQYYKLQDGKCLHCKCNLSSEPPKRVKAKVIKWSLFPKGFMKHSIHLQHNHKTGFTEGIVHAYCNAVLWQYYKR